MKLILGFILVILIMIMASFSMTYGQDKNVKAVTPVKSDTLKIVLTAWQKQHIDELQAPAAKLVREYLEAIISTVADPKKVRYGMDDKGRIVILKIE